MSGVKCLAGAGGFIASGGGDDLVRCAPRAATRFPRASLPLVSRVFQRQVRVAGRCGCDAASARIGMRRFAALGGALRRGGCVP